MPACVPPRGVHSCPPPCAVDRISHLTWLFVRRSTSTNPVPGNCQLHGLSRLPSRPTDHERPPDMAMVDGDQAANAWCHDGRLRSAFRVIRDGSLRTAHAADLRERTLTNLRRPLSAALAVWGSGFESPQLHPGCSCARWGRPHRALGRGGSLAEAADRNRNRNATWTLTDGRVCHRTPHPLPPG